MIETLLWIILCVLIFATAVIVGLLRKSYEELCAQRRWNQAHPYLIDRDGDDT